MKKIYVFIACLFLGLIGFRIVRTKPPEVIKIYKTIPYQPKPTRTLQKERLITSLTETQVAETEHPNTLQTDEGIEDNRISEYELSPEEESEFWEWLTGLEEPPTETLDTKPEEVTEPEGNPITELPYSELAKMVTDVYELEDVLNDYDVYVDEGGGSGYCPFCYQQDFQVMEYVKTGRREFWCCFNCSNRSSNVIEFVSRIKRIDELQAAMFLAKQAGIIE